MDLLTEIGIKYNTDKATQHKFTEVYEKYFSDLKDKTLNIFEIGVYHGGSIRMLKEYFQNSNIYAIDIEDKKSFIEDRIEIEQGDQTDREFLSKVFGDKTFDIIIDDGGHSMEMQQVSLEVMFKRLNPGGLYIVEDLHTSLGRWASVGGSDNFRNNNTTLHLMEQIILGSIEKDNTFYIKDFDSLLGQIEKCNVYVIDPVSSITSVILKKS